ncbi:hypothetical protein KSS87_012563 [Heliosperma pusillum]|nr:hypothetical protein KSS87_012563 [Heliosperma pusillum]
MGEKKEEDLYRNFSRKDLQGLCKKYGLPANKSSSEMATSLILYLENKNISSKTIWEVSRSDPYSSLWSELQPGVRMDSAGNKRTDLREMSSHNGFGQFLKHGDPNQNDFRSRKASEEMGRLTQLHRDSNSGAGDVENTFSSVLSSTAEASLPTFTYDISCEDGIQLFVDLNSTTSDWVESLKAGVHICNDSHNLQSSGSDEKKGYLLMDSHNNQLLVDESCPTAVGTSVALQAEEFGKGSLSTTGPDSFKNTVHNREELGEERAMLSSKSKHDTKQRHHDSEYSARIENEVVIHRFSGNTMPYDLKWSKTGDGMYTETRWEQTCSPPDPVLKSSRLSATPFVGIETSPSVNFLQRHDVASSSRVAPRLVLANQLQKSSILHFGPFAPGQLRGGVPQMWPVQAMDQSPYASSSYLMSGLSDVGHQSGIEHGRVSIPSKSSRLAQEIDIQSVQSCEKSRPYFPVQGLPLTNPNIDTNIIAGNGRFISSNGVGQEAVKLPKKDVSLGPFNIDGPLHFAVPKKNHADHHIFNYSNNLDKDVDRGQVRNNLVHTYIFTTSFGLVSSILLTWLLNDTYLLLYRVAAKPVMEPRTQRKLITKCLLN